MRKSGKPGLRNLVRSLECSGKLPMHRAGGFGVVAEIDGQQAAFPKRFALMKRLQRRFQTVDNIAGATDFWWMLMLE